MWAAVYRGENKIAIESVPIPQIGPGEALIRVLACGVCGTDLKKIHYGLVPPPRIFGHEICGRIKALGAGVTGFQVGERVSVTHHVPCLNCHYCRYQSSAQCPKYRETGTTAGFTPAGGGFAEYVRVMDWVVKRGMVLVPEAVSDDAATFIEPLNTCLKAVYRAEAKEGESALVIGQGPIGLLFTQLLAVRGITVIAADPLKARREQSLRFKAAAACDGDPTSWMTAAMRWTDERGFDLVILTAPNAELISSAMQAARAGGRLLLFGQTKKDDPFTVDAGTICSAEKSLIGSYSSDISLQAEVADLIFSHRVDVDSLVTHRFQLSEIERAIEVASTPRDGVLKVMVNP